jgi:hypothetical protein
MKESGGGNAALLYSDGGSDAQPRRTPGYTPQLHELS